MPTSFSHRNGETEPPTVIGWYWAQDAGGREQMMYVGDNAAPPHDPANIVDWFANYIGDEMDLQQADFAGWRWWGPVEAPVMNDG